MYYAECFFISVGKGQGYVYLQNIQTLTLLGKTEFGFILNPVKQIGGFS